MDYDVIANLLDCLLSPVNYNFNQLTGREQVIVGGPETLSRIEEWVSQKRRPYFHVGQRVEATNNITDVNREGEYIHAFTGQTGTVECVDDGCSTPTWPLVRWDRTSGSQTDRQTGCNTTDIEPASAIQSSLS